MDIKNEIPEELYKLISSNYESGNYSEAILDAIKYLTKIIRNYSGIDEDGEKLVGGVFNSKPPLLKFNRMETQSEQDEHNGLAFLLRGVYSGIRNPRSHEKYHDLKEECDMILIMICYPVTKINATQNLFDIEKYSESIFDKLFANNDKYAESLVDKIPDKDISKTAIYIMKERNKGNPESLRFFFMAIYKKAKPDQLKEFLEYISDELLKVQDDNSIIDLIQYINIKPDFWHQIRADAKMRVEAQIIRSIEKGIFNGNVITGNINQKGVLGTWSLNIGRYFELKRSLEETLVKKLLKGDWYEQNYIGFVFAKHLPKIIENEKCIKNCCKNLCYATMGNNARILMAKLLEAVFYYPHEWLDLICKYAEEYKSNKTYYYQELLKKIEEAKDIPF
jgi:uncharacterized protein (TIGR02391 family)